MSIFPFPSVLNTAEAELYVGGKPMWDELEAIYGHNHLRPLRTLPCGKQSWSTQVIDGVLQKAQADGTLNDRKKVDAAMQFRRQQKEAQSKKQLEAV